MLRDIVLLREQGYPIESSRGKGEGVAISSLYGTGKLLLGDEEVIHTIVAFAIAEKSTVAFVNRKHAIIAE